MSKKIFLSGFYHHFNLQKEIVNFISWGRDPFTVTKVLGFFSLGKWNWYNLVKYVHDVATTIVCSSFNHIPTQTLPNYMNLLSKIEVLSKLKGVYRDMADKNPCNFFFFKYSPQVLFVHFSGMKLVSHTFG